MRSHGLLVFNMDDSRWVTHGAGGRPSVTELQKKKNKTEPTHFKYID